MNQCQKSNALNKRQWCDSFATNYGDFTFPVFNGFVKNNGNMLLHFIYIEVTVTCCLNKNKNKNKLNFTKIFYRINALSLFGICCFKKFK